MKEISSIGANAARINSTGKKPLEKEANVQPEAQNANVKPEAKQTISADQVMNFMGTMGAQNLANVKTANKINPKDYLSQERINDISGSMTTFNGGVEEHKAELDKELGSVPSYNNLSEAQKYQYAAEAFAHAN